jgi:hypothetical protein
MTDPSLYKIPYKGMADLIKDSNPTDSKLSLKIADFLELWLEEKKFEEFPVLGQDEKSLEQVLPFSFKRV